MDETKLEGHRDSIQNELAQVERLNSLVEGNQAAHWIHSTLMKKMDKYAFARSLVLFCLFGFFLGNNLGIFLWLYITVTMYLIFYRVIRFWVKRWLMYLIEFCYFGNTLLICYIIWFGQSIEVFYTVFVCSTGVMAFAVIIFNNQAHFNSTDHLTSSYIHTFPLISVWAIRWRHLIYPVDNSSKYFNFCNFNSEFQFSDNYALSIYPILYWLFWAGFYLLINSTLLHRYYNNPKFGSGVRDFLEAKESLKFIFGDLYRTTLLKYILQHFVFFLAALPLTWLCFYNFKINTIYLILIIIFLGWNTGRNNMKHLEKKLIKNEKKNKVEENYNI